MEQTAVINESKKIEYWNYLTNEKYKPRPRGITVQRLALIKPAVLRSELWLNVVNAQAAAEFFKAANPASELSRTNFWEMVRLLISQESQSGRRNRRRRF